MLKKTLVANSRRKQTAVFLVVCIAASCSLLGVGMIRSSQAQDALQKYEDIGSLPIEKRRAAFNSASSKNKSDFFRTHLALYLARHPELNETQKQVILESMSLATPELYEVPRDSAEWKAKVEGPMKEFDSHVRAVFSKDEGARIFATLGDQEAQDGLLQKYRDLSALPMLKRKAAFRNASTKDKSNLWRTHLALYLAKHSELTKDQTNVIIEALSLLTPALFDSGVDTLVWQARAKAQLLEARIHSIFSRNERARIFGTLGPPENPAKASIDILSSRPVQTLVRSIWEQDEAGWACSCSYKSDACEGASHCVAGACRIAESGCGFLWLYQCDGRCQSDYSA